MLLDDIIKELSEIRERTSGNLVVTDNTGTLITRVEIKENLFDDEAEPNVVIIADNG